VAELVLGKQKTGSELNKASDALASYPNFAKASAWQVFNIRLPAAAGKL